MYVLPVCRILSRLRCVTSDIVAYTCSGVGILHQRFTNELNISSTMEAFYVRCIAHVINFGGKDFLGPVRGKMDRIRAFISALRTYVKSRNCFSKLKVELGMDQVTMPVLDLDTRWSSTYGMVRHGYKERRFINAAVQKTPEVTSMVLHDDEWDYKSYLWIFGAGCLHHKDALRFSIRKFKHQRPCIQEAC